MKGSESLEENIQRKILSDDVSIVTILFSAKALAQRDRNKQMKLWVKNELEGYHFGLAVPDYRVFRTIPTGTFRNLAYQTQMGVPLFFMPDWFQEGKRKTPVNESISKIQKLATGQDQRFAIPWTPEEVGFYNNFVYDHIDGGYSLVEAHNPIMASDMQSILDTVKSRLQDYLFEIQSLDWTIQDNQEMRSEIVEQKFINIILQDNKEQHMTTFDQREQHVNTQYNTGRDINFDENMSPDEFAEKLDQIIQQLEAYLDQEESQNAEDIIKAKADLEIAKVESVKQDPNQSKIQSFLHSAQNNLATIADLAQIVDLIIIAIPLVSSLFN